MPAVGETLRVEGLADLNDAFRLADRKVRREKNDQLRELAEPVRVDAQTLAVSSIRRIGLPWSQMRVGVTRTSVYVAPRQRGARFRDRKRPNLAGLLLDRAMLPALRINEAQIASGVDRWLGEVGRAWERA